MTVYALRLENGADTAARVRMGDALAMPAGPTLLSTREGFRPEPGVALPSVVNGTMQVTVAPFLAWLDGGVSAPQGGYPVVSDTTVTLILAAGDPSQSRTDAIAVVVNDDPFDGSGSIDADVLVVQGTPGAGVPALPTNSLLVATATVPAGLSEGTGGLSSGNLTDKRTYIGTGGIIPVLSQAERDAMPITVGLAVYRMDTNVLEVYGTGGWQTIDVTSSGSISPGVVNLPGTPEAGRFVKTAGRAELWFRFNVTGAAGPNLRVTLPWPAHASVAAGLPTPVGTVIAIRQAVGYFRGILALGDVNSAWLYTDGLQTWGNSTPAAFNNGDVFAFHLSYPLA